MDLDDENATDFNETNITDIDFNETDIDFNETNATDVDSTLNPQS